MTAGDPVRHRRAVDRARSEFDQAPGPPAVVAPEVVASWHRCRAVLPVHSQAPVDLDDPHEAWLRSPIRLVAGGLVDELAALATREDYVAAITDPAGRILWSSAGHSMHRLAERAAFVCGANWSEHVAGTNAPGLVLQTGRPAAVFAGEHWCDSVRDWVCYAAPVRDPSGAVVGVLDLSSHWRRANPLALTFITSYARLVEHELARQVPAAGPELRIAVLGPPRVTLRHAEVRLGFRQLELLSVLALHDGLHLGELHALVHGDRQVASATVKAEISHLRRLVDHAIGSRPYRLTIPVEVDVAVVLEALRRADLDTALRHYRGSLLPASESPYLSDLRNHLEVVLGDALLRHGDAAQLQRYASLHPWDVRITERILALGRR